MCTFNRQAEVHPRSSFSNRSQIFPVSSLGRKSGGKPGLRHQSTGVWTGNYSRVGIDYSWAGRAAGGSHNSSGLEIQPIARLGDSHSSLEAADTIQLFSAASVRVVIFPPHCAHFFQLFDACLTRRMKSAI
jgi:hypothetical protein